MYMNIDKRWNHNCEACQYLGHFKVSMTERYDLYYCKQKFWGPTLIARYGNESDEYISGLLFAYRDRDNLTSPLGEAYRLAKQKNLFLMPCGGLAPEDNEDDIPESFHKEKE